MNQILDYNPIRNGDSNDNYNNRNMGNKSNVIKAFAIILIIFAKQLKNRNHIIILKVNN